MPDSETLFLIIMVNTKHPIKIGTNKNIIRSYNFAEGQFNMLPQRIFKNRRGLSEMDRIIIDAIKFQMTISKANNMIQTINYNNIYRTVSAGVAYTLIGFLLVSLTYYANVNLNLGMNFLTELFA